ncbi:ferredoxin-2, mitochondrial [Trichonephila clavata]|uniref:Ferredoxin-2, mitochondrial n=1 Tax=Trichonephila clavata TaxID=2740835 RepID=A0A8X6G4D3_TRICU|nr:ferredoxin-2, mitochondrial [Trichonephila clavata]
MRFRIRGSGGVEVVAVESTASVSMLLSSELASVRPFMTAVQGRMLTEHKWPFVWTEECEVAFTSLKEALTSAPISSYPDPDKQFILDTDASHANIGAVLSQEIDGQERVIAYWSKCLSKPERNYCVTRKELLAIVKAVENFHSYVYGRKFLHRTDHASLTWLLNFKNPEGQIARWIQKLQEPIDHTRISMAEENSKRVKISFVIFETGEKVEVEGEIGQNILEVALANDVGMLGSCEGYVRCTICHVYVDDKSKEILPRATEEECDLIDRALDPKENSRLSCQCILSKNLEGAVFTLPLTTRNVELEDSKK